MMRKKNAVGRDREGGRHLLLNLLEVDHIDTARIGELVMAHSTLRRQGSQLKLANLSGKVKDVLNSVFDIQDDEASTVKSFGSLAATA